MRAFGSGHWIRPPLTSLFLWPRILCLISADDLSVVLSKRLTFVLTSGPRDCLYGARFGHFPSTCPAYALVFFRCFVFLVHLHIDDLSCNDPIYDPSLRFFLLARNIDDPSASNEKKVGRGEDERVKGDDLSGRRLLFGPSPMGVSRTRGRRIYKFRKEESL